MPSFIYIARIRSLTDELAQSLRSAGCHVESFKPGQVTQDECLLAMTPEAADGALHANGTGTKKGFRCDGCASASATTHGRGGLVFPENGHGQ